MTDDVVERVARAIEPCIGFGIYDPDPQSAIQAAQAALAALKPGDEIGSLYVTSKADFNAWHSESRRRAAEEMRERCLTAVNIIEKHPHQRSEKAQYALQQAYAAIRALPVEPEND